MELPDWVVDDVLPHRRQSATMLLIGFYRHGAPRFIADARRLYLARPQEELAVLVHVNLRSLQRAIAELQESYLLEHAPSRWRAPSGLSWPVDRPEMTRQSVTPFSAGSDSKGLAENPYDTTDCRPTLTHRHGGGGSYDPDPGLKDSDPPTTPIARARTYARLLEADVASPEEWLERFGDEPLEAALTRLDQTGGYRSGPGLMHSWLVRAEAQVRRGEFPDLLSTPSPPPDLTTLEGIKAKYLGGRIS